MSNIDTEARRKLAEILERYLLGKITNFQLEKLIPKSGDRIISAIELSIWHYYDDFKEEVFCNTDISNEEISKIQRWILFLKTNEEYLWPSFPSPGEQPLPLGCFARFLKSEQKQHKFMSYADYSVWPFLDQETYLKYKDHL